MEKVHGFRASNKNFLKEFTDVDFFCWGIPSEEEVWQMFANPAYYPKTKAEYIENLKQELGSYHIDDLEEQYMDEITTFLEEIGVPSEAFEKACKVGKNKRLTESCRAVRFITEEESEINEAVQAFDSYFKEEARKKAKKAGLPPPQTSDGENEQRLVAAFFKANPHIEKLYGNVMGDYTITHPLKMLVWEPEFDCSEVTLHGQPIASSLEWLSCSDRCLITIKDDSLEFTNLQVVDIQSEGMSTRDARILLANAQKLTYLSLGFLDPSAENDGDTMADQPIEINCPLLKVAHLYGGRWLLKSSLSSLEEFGFTAGHVEMTSTCWVDMEGPLVSVKKLHFHGDKHVAIPIRDTREESKRSALFPNVTDLRARDLHSVNDFGDVLTRLVCADNLSLLQVTLKSEAHKSHGSVARKDKTPSPNRDEYLAILKQHRKGKVAGLRHQFDGEFKSQTLDSYRDGRYGLGYRRKGHWGLCT